MALKRWSVGTLGERESDTGPWVRFTDVKNYENALGQIAALWPDPGMCAEVAPEFVGPNDGRIRADLLWTALNTARAALNLPTYGRPEHWGKR